jgi:hypothetical protein
MVSSTALTVGALSEMPRVTIEIRVFGIKSGCLA